MARFIYTEEMKQWLRDNSYGRWAYEIAPEFTARFGWKVTPKVMGAALRRFGIKTDVKKLRKYECDNRMSLTTVEQNKIIKEHFQDKGFGSYKLLQQFLKEQFGIEFTLVQCKAYCCRHGLRFGVYTHFKKGHVPKNKGVKMTPEQRAKFEHTWFKKGERSVNWVPVGTQRFRGGYMVIKIAEPNKWRLMSRVVWERETGEKLQKTDRIITLDGNPRNMDISNLRKVTMADISIMNGKGLRSNIPEVTEVGITVSKLIRAKKEALKHV